jgi:hypothetical protein
MYDFHLEVENNRRRLDRSTVSIDLQAILTYSQLSLSIVLKQYYVSKFNGQFLLKHILVYINLYCSKAYFLKKDNFLQIYIFKEIGEFYRETVNINNVSNIKIHIFL